MQFAKHQLNARFGLQRARLMTSPAPWCHTSPFHPSVRHIIAERQGEPLHGFSQPATFPNFRADLASSGARQRLRHQLVRGGQSFQSWWAV